jgi:hypothetical protein
MEVQSKGSGSRRNDSRKVGGRRKDAATDLKLVGWQIYAFIVLVFDDVVVAEKKTVPDLHAHSPVIGKPLEEANV